MKRLMVPILLLTAAPLAASDLWLHVRATGSEGERVSVNVPFGVVALVPHLVDAADGECTISIDGAEIGGSDLRRVITSVRQAPENSTVIVPTERGTVQAGRTGGMLQVLSVDARGRKSELRMPFWLAETLSTGSGRELNVGAAVDAIVARREGDLSIRTDDGEQVRIWVDRIVE